MHRMCRNLIELNRTENVIAAPVNSDVKRRAAS